MIAAVAAAAAPPVVVAAVAGNLLLLLLLRWLLLLPLPAGGGAVTGADTIAIVIMVLVKVQILSIKITSIFLEILESHQFWPFSQPTHLTQYHEPLALVDRNQFIQSMISLGYRV